MKQYKEHKTFKLPMQVSSKASVSGRELVHVVQALKLQGEGKKGSKIS